MNNHPYEIELALAASKHPTRLLRESWGEFVARWPWEWFVTLTFTEDVHPERAMKLWYLWCSKLNREIYGRNWHKKEPFGVTWVVAEEHQKMGRVHLHALIAGVFNTRRLTWMDKWNELDPVAGIARIYKVENQVAVTRYVTKYVTKDGEVMPSENLKIRHGDLFDLPSGHESET